MIYNIEERLLRYLAIECLHYNSDKSKVSSAHGNPNATIDPPTPLYDWTLPVGTNNTPSPTDAPPTPIGPSTAAVHIFFPVSLSSANITPVLI